MKKSAPPPGEVSPAAPLLVQDAAVLAQAYSAALQIVLASGAEAGCAHFAALKAMELATR